MTRGAFSVLLVAISLALTSCGGGGNGPAATKTVTVSASPASSPTEAADSPSAATSSAAVPAPDGSDFQATAIYTVQTETDAYRGAPDALVRNLLRNVCQGLVVTDGKHVDKFGFEIAETMLDSLGIAKNEYPVVVRAATAFCPDTLEAVAKHYGTS